MSSSVPQIVVVGSCNVDLITYMHGSLPKPGETIHGYKFHSGCGGKGANQGTAAARVSGDRAQVSFVGCVGDDVFGKEFLASFESDGIITNHVRVCDGLRTGTAAILVEGSGQNMIAIAPGANAEVVATDLEKPDIAHVIQSADVLLLQNEIPLESTIKSLQLAKQSTKKVVSLWNIAPAQVDVTADQLSLASIICVNESEASAILRTPVATVDDAISAARRFLVDYHVSCILITLGALGTVYGTIDAGNESISHVPAPKVDRVVDTTGAGDAFVGAFAYYFSTGHSLRESIECANRYASITVQRPGTQTSYPKRNEISIEN